MSFVLGSKSSKRIIVLCTTIVILFILYLSTLYSTTIHQSQCHLLSVNIPSLSLNLPSNNNNNNNLFTNFNHITSSAFNAQKNKEKILVLTPLKNAGPYLDQYFKLLDETIYPNHLISLAFLVSDSSDDTFESLQSHINEIQSRWNSNSRFESVRIFKKDFDFDLPSSKRHQYEMQPLRRSIMARSRNWLLSAALKSDTSWVAWIDVDVVEYPPSIFQDLMRADADVVVPNCLLKRDDLAFWAYDKNNWQETDESRRIQQGLDEDFVLLEGYYEFPTYRYLMVDMPTDVGKDYKVELDGVGATFTLVKAHVHREGANFPAFTYQHQVETEGFAKMAKSMGFSVYGLPGYLIYHIQNH